MLLGVRTYLKLAAELGISRPTVAGAFRFAHRVLLLPTKATLGSQTTKSLSSPRRKQNCLLSFRSSPLRFELRN